MIEIHPDIIDQLEEWVRGDPRRSMWLRWEPEDQGWALTLSVSIMQPAGYWHNAWERLDIITRGGRTEVMVQRAIEKLAEHTEQRPQLPTSEAHYDWLYAWPSHRIERSNRLMLHMLETDRPWTGRYFSD